jgi:CubicO group peptidase (beta-lactamase class C family)
MKGRVRRRCYATVSPIMRWRFQSLCPALGRFCPPVGLLFGLLAAVSAVCSAGDDRGFTWTRTVPESRGVDSFLIEDLVARVRAEALPVHSLLIVRDERLLHESYFAGYNANSLHQLYSVSKSFTSAAIGVAIERGYLAGVDERVVDIFSDRTILNPSPAKSAMTVHHLLSMATGHARDTTDAVSRTSDWVHTFLNLPVERPPGSLFVYNSGATVMLSAIIQKRTGRNLLEFAREHLFEPLGIQNHPWQAGPGDLTTGGWGLSLTPRDMMKFGLLYLHRGRWGDRQLVPAQWVDRSAQLQVNNGPPNSAWNVGYGYQFWLNPWGGYRAEGYAGQYIVILPEDDAVLVITAGYADHGPSIRLIEDHLVRALADKPRTEDDPTTGRPELLLEPVSVAVAPGEPASFAVRASGGGLTYQWFNDSRPLPDATGPRLIVPAVSADQAGRYTVRVANTHGEALSREARLELAEPRSRARLTNLSARAQAGSAEDTLIIGFGIAGGPLGQGLPVLLRGIGPALAEFGLDGVLRDPTLTLYSDQRRRLTFNDDWSREPDAGSIGGRVGAFAPPARSRDAALSLTLAPGVYSAHVAGVQARDRGVALAECYDASASSTEQSGRLINLSARARTSAGEGTLIAGFVVAGEGTQRVLVRAIGPTLSSFGVAGALHDPVLRVYRNQSVIAENDDWGGDPVLASGMIGVGAFELPSESRDAALLLELAAGNYTAHVSVKAGESSGIGLIELYALSD